MSLSKRLKAICELVKPGLGVADIGADHGLVEKYLLDNDVSPCILAVENKKGPYEILKNALSDYENVRISLSDGVEDVDEKVKILIIAGMGGINIVNILSKNPQKLANIEQIIVDPHRDQELVKQELKKLNYKIEKEIELIDAKKHYTIISFTK